MHQCLYTSLPLRVWTGDASAWRISHFLHQDHGSGHSTVLPRASLYTGHIMPWLGRVTWDMMRPVSRVICIVELYKRVLLFFSINTKTANIQKF
ncbi:hypothetical protein GDO81_005202 [Engystomops pustulosus]|uniref:Uncharacterized protein n=1 Tax=Engystomops pustulosus TaxID=76066 RepID=A0AAV7CLP5_ENGPU|nr:hypothetical protein GDO81_005202 [Engystomops pustulosus]